MAKISFILTNSGTLNIVANGRSYVVPKDHKNYDQIKESVKKDDADNIDRLVNVGQHIERFGEGNVTVEGGVVSYRGEPVHDNICHRILKLKEDGFPFKPMMLFLSNIMENPSYHSRHELYAFLEHQGLPITEDGCFLGYKRVKMDYTDKNSGKFSNKVGVINEIPRNTVDDNWRLDCSSGFHVGSIEYVRHFGTSEEPVVICKVNPKDVVSVPGNETTKLRTCKYEVVGEYDRTLLNPMPDTLHTPQGTPMERPSSGMGGYGYQNDEDEDDDEDSVLELDEEDDDDEDDKRLYPTW